MGLLCEILNGDWVKIRRCKISNNSSVTINCKSVAAYQIFLVVLLSIKDNFLYSRVHLDVRRDGERKNFITWQTKDFIKALLSFVWKRKFVKFERGRAAVRSVNPPISHWFYREGGKIKDTSQKTSKRKRRHGIREILPCFSRAFYGWLLKLQVWAGSRIRPADVTPEFTFPLRLLFQRDNAKGKKWKSILLHWRQSLFYGISSRANYLPMRIIRKSLNWKNGTAPNCFWGKLLGKCGNTKSRFN